MSEYDDSFSPESSGIDLSAFDDDFSSAEAPSFDSNSRRRAIVEG